jgi:hypothetical protein
MWASFAVRKGVPTDTGVKRLAIRTHDHSRKEALMTGRIESGYGAGDLKKWDSGSCEIIKYSISHIAIDFKGRKIKGIYHLVNTGLKDKKYEGKQYWLFKGKIKTESCGMISRVPHTWGDEVERNEIDDYSKKLPWSNTNSTVGKPLYKSLSSEDEQEEP